MKKTIALTLALIMALTLAACGGNNDTPSGGNTTPPTNTPSGNTDTPTPPDNSQLGETPDGGNNDAVPTDGEFLYATAGYDANSVGYEITEFLWVNSFVLFFTGDTTGDWLPPAINDLELYIDGIPQQAAISENTYPNWYYITPGYNDGAFKLQTQYMSDKRDDVTYYEFWLNERYDTPSEYRIEATVNGVKISSNTFIWHGGTDIEYLDDMPVPATPPVLTAFSYPAPDEIVFVHSDLWDIPLDIVIINQGYIESVSPQGEYVFSALPDCFKKGVGPLPDTYDFHAFLIATATTAGTVATMVYEFELGTRGNGEVVITADDALTLREHYLNNGLDIVDERHDYNLDGTLKYYTAKFSFKAGNCSGTVDMGWQYGYLTVICTLSFD